MTQQLHNLCQYLFFHWTNAFYQSTMTIKLTLNVSFYVSVYGSYLSERLVYISTNYISIYVPIGHLCYDHLQLNVRFSISVDNLYLQNFQYVKIVTIASNHVGFFILTVFCIYSILVEISAVTRRWSVQLLDWRRWTKRLYVLVYVLRKRR